MPGPKQNSSVRAVADHVELQPPMAKKEKFDPAIHDENPEWTEEMFARAKSASEVLSSEILAKFKNGKTKPERSDG